LIVIEPLSYLPICLYALEELSIHLQIFDKLSLRLRNLKLRGGAGERGYGRCRCVRGGLVVAGPRDDAPSPEEGRGDLAAALGDL